MQSSASPVSVTVMREGTQTNLAGWQTVSGVLSQFLLRTEGRPPSAECHLRKKRETDGEIYTMPMCPYTKHIIIAYYHPVKLAAMLKVLSSLQLRTADCTAEPRGGLY